ncbi:MAG: hypothetical protein ACRDHL_13555, partial [Candidatus Promineifilaceae bacterium]
MADANYGYGYPFFHFYAPLSVLVSALLRLAGFSLAHAVESSQLLGFALAGWSAFHLGRRWLGGAPAGLLASAAYTLAPFHLVNVYVRGDSLAEFWAMAFYPAVLLAADRLLRPGPNGAPRPVRGAAWLGLAYAGLVLSHNISALIFTPFLLLYLALLGHAAGGRRLAWAGAGLLLGLILSAWFWLPALAERNLAQLGPVTAGYFHYSGHFRGLDLIQRSPLFDYEVAGGAAFRMGLAQAALTAAGLLALAVSLLAGRKRRRPAYLFMLLGLGISTLMFTPASRPLWDRLPLLAFAQFPWRFLSVQALFGALAVGLLALLPGRRLVAPAALLLLALAAFGRLQTESLLLGEADLTPERLAAYEWFSANIGSTVSAEYLPPSVQTRPYTSPWLNAGRRDQVIVLAGSLSDAALVERATGR